MEERARMQEKLLQIEKKGPQRGSNPDVYNDTIEKTIAVNDMYIDAI